MKIVKSFFTVVFSLLILVFSSVEYGMIADQWDIPAMSKTNAMNWAVTWPMILAIFFALCIGGLWKDAR